MTDARALLRQLAAANVPFVTFGSTGLALLHPSHFPGTRLTDVDVLLGSGVDTLLAFVHFARSHQGTVTSWGEPFDVAHRNNALEGRFYVRARFEDGLQLDATYENVWLDADALVQRAHWVDGVPICPEEELWCSKYHTNPKKAQRFASEHGLVIPSAAIERAHALMRDTRGMSSTRIRLRVNAPRSRVYRALLDARAVQQWMVPTGMTSHVHAFDAREGGFFRISLTYDAPTGAGKTTAHTDTHHGRFVKLVPDEQVVQVVEFETTDPSMQGEMTITFSLTDADGGTEVLAIHDGVPPGVPPADNELGWRLSLEKLAALVEGG